MTTLYSSSTNKGVFMTTWYVMPMEIVRFLKTINIFAKQRKKRNLMSSQNQIMLYVFKKKKKKKKYRHTI